jgi:hypothetical protein
MLSRMTTIARRSGHPHWTISRFHSNSHGHSTSQTKTDKMAKSRNGKLRMRPMFDQFGRMLYGEHTSPALVMERLAQQNSLAPLDLDDMNLQLFPDTTMSRCPRKHPRERRHHTVHPPRRARPRGHAPFQYSNGTSKKVLYREYDSHLEANNPPTRLSFRRMPVESSEWDWERREEEIRMGRRVPFSRG